MFVRLPVVCQIIAAFPSRKSRGVAPHEIRPEGCVASTLDRSSQACADSITFGSSNDTLLPSGFVRRAALPVVMPVKSQAVLPSDGIWMPHCVVAPEASFLVSFLAMSRISAQLAGPLFGSRPAALNKSLFQ